MRRNCTFVILLLSVCASFPTLAVAQTGALGTVKGVCKDAEGNPIADAQVVWHNDDNGRTYKLKTNKKGEYFSLGIEPSENYTITLTKDGKQLFTQSKLHVGVDEFDKDIDIKAEKEQQIKDTAKQTGLTPEQIQQKLAEQKKVESYNANVKQVNEKLKAANTALQAQPPNYDNAIASLNEASQLAPNEDLVWFRLGSVYLDSDKTQTDAAARTKRDTEAYNDLKKAIDLKKNAQSSEGAPPKKPEEVAADNSKLAAYYGNFGSAALRISKTDEAIEAYKQAIQLDPSRAGNNYFNLGVVLHNSAKNVDDRKAAIDALDKAIAADPTKADAYYLRGAEGIGLSSQDSSGKLVAPQGTEEALKKYLELQPSGSHAEEVKGMLTALNASVETGYGGKKAATKKKK